MRTLITLAVAALASLMLAGCGGGAGASAAPETKAPATPKTFNVTGHMTLRSDSINTNENGESGDDCYGTSGFDDMTDGTQAVVRSNTGKTLAIGAISNPTLMDDSFSVCRFDVSVDDVPTGQGPYSIEVSHRGGINFTEDESVVELTLGDGS